MSNVTEQLLFSKKLMILQHFNQLLSVKVLEVKLCNNCNKIRLTVLR